MTKTAKILGIEHDVKSFNHTIPNTLEQQFELKSYIEVTSNRSNNTINTIKLEENDLIAIQFTDNTEWIGHPEDVQAIYDNKTLAKRSLAAEDYIFDIQIISEDANRGVIKRALVKVFSVFSPKKVAEVAIMDLAKSYDKKIQPNPGLYLVDSNFKRIKYSPPSNTSKPFLLLLHGTLSTSMDAFQKLNSNNSAWNDIVGKYGNRIWALDHYTLSVSPLQNALDFLNACPNGCTIDIISHSRGGLVADILAKCDYRNNVVGFSTNEINILKSEGEKAHYEFMEAINKIAKNKKLTVNKVIRVAAPASGTTILSRRIDHFFNLFLNAVSIAFGIANPLYHTVKGFLLELVSQKDNPDILPGLNAMMPESMFQKMMNISGSVVESDLYNIAGDSEVGGINFSSLKVILANLFYQEANDLVVDTRRMEHGVVRKNGIYKHVSQGSDTNHFNYFSENGSCPAILEALNASSQNHVTLFTKSEYINGERGVLLDALSLKGIRYAPEKITRDVVIIVPGIMGSTIAHNGDHLWVDMRKLNDGGITKSLNISASNVEATGVIEKYYNNLAEHLLEQYDVITMEFDWRKSLKDAAKILKDKIESVLKYQNIKIHIIAHSMGGLLVRQLMMDFSNVWSEFNRNESNKFIMLGTPWLGSYLIMEVLTGHSSRVKQLAAIDFKNNRADLLKIFWKYPGIFELLPIEEGTNRDFWDPKFWKDLDSEADLKNMPNPDTNTKSLSGFKDYRKNVQDYLNALEEKTFKNIFYICGQADKTVFDYSLQNRFLSSKRKLVYKATSFGDGSVTWASGIPKQLLGSNHLFYSQTSHGDLANDPEIFQGISEILSTGSTNALSTQKPASRGGEVISEVYEAPEPAYNSDAVLNAIFDIKKQEKAKNSYFNVKVIHGDLRVASYPVMVGHFFMDLILSAEKALDNYLEKRLSQRMGIGYYPGQVGESEVFFNLDTQPKGAIVCGLGSTEGLTHYLLSNAVKQATLKYAMFMRDNYTLSRAKKYAKGISFVLIGSGYGKLSVEDSVKGILLGVSKANNQILDTKEGLEVIQEIEIINYYESYASEAYFSLSRQQGTDDRIPFILNKGITKRAGAKKRRMFHSNEYDWWYNLHIDSVENDDKTCGQEHEIIGFKYFSSSSLARVEQEMVGIGLFKINHLLKEMSSSSTWDVRLSKSLFEMLVPNDFKTKFRDQNNLVLKLDKHAAQIPWELLHDNTASETPASVTSSFIRQLITEDSVRYNQVSLNNIEAFIVGDPIYNQKELPQLPAAKAEAEWVAIKLKKAGYNTNTLINSNAKNIMMELFNKHYKIMHFAGHGVYDPEHCNVGIAIGSGICIDPAMINQIGYVPDFIFINCCYSGVLDAEDDVYSKNRNRLAANIGTQLIEMGVKAIIISGWAVNDGAAKVFSETFYERMFQGYNFGNAVQMARLECYQKYRNSNTWGAYQCYGNQFYKFRDRTRLNQNKEEYVVASQIHTDLDNLLIAIRDKKEDKNSAQIRLDKYITLAQESNLLDAMVLEKEAMIYDELGMSNVAYEKYTNLFVHDNGNYSIKALEQYCMVLSSVVKSDILKAKESKKPDAVNEVISKYIATVEFLTLAGRNARRLNIVGNTYKHTAKYLDSKKEIEYLKIAFEYYNEALDATDDRFSGQYLDALSNMIFTAFVLESLGNEKLLPQLQKSKAFKHVKNLEEFLENLYKELDEFDKADLDISVLIGMTEVSYAILLINPNNKNHHEETILMWYKQIFQQLYSPRYISIEIEQIGFLLHYVKIEKVRKCLKLIENELINYKN